MYAINRASADGLRYGRDFAFTFGPLGFATCPMDVGNNLAAAAAFRVALHLAWLTAVAVLAWPHPGWRVAPFAVGAALAAAPIHPHVSNLDRVGVLLATVVYLLIAAAAADKRWPAALAAVVAGAAVLVKANVGVACVGAVAGYGLAEAARRGRPGVLRAVFVLGVCGLTAALLGLPYFGDPGAAADFARASLLIADGYSSHMTSPGDSVPAPWVVAAAAAAVLGGVGWAAWAQPDLRPDALILAAPLFVLYKSAVVRCDALHWRPALFHALALLAAFALRGRTRPALAVGRLAAAGAFLILADAAINQGLADRVGWGPRAVGHMADWSAARAKLAEAERDLSADAVAAFPHPPTAEHGPEFRPWLPTLDREARTDVYPVHLLIARDAGLAWRPRYVPQSYTAYHPALDDAVAETYRRADAPTFVVYEFGAIDHYLPFAVDPLTLTELVRWYEPVRRLDADSLLLRRRAAPALGDPRSVARGVARPGEVLPVPPAGPGEVVFLALDYELTPLGRAMSFAYRVEPPRVGVFFPGGAGTDPKVAWRNAASGIPISPLPFGVEAMAEFLAGGDATPTAAVVLQPNPAFAPEVPYEWRKAARR